MVGRAGKKTTTQRAMGADPVVCLFDHCPLRLAVI
jgi:hypothetical protein